MDAVILQAVLPEIREALEGHPVTKVELSGKYGVLLRFGGSRRNLFLSAHPELSRLGLVDAPPDAGEPRPAPDNLSEPLLRARLVAVEQEPNGRVARFRFEHAEARHRHPALVAELIPRFANLILVGNDDRILWSKREFEGNRPREIVAGRKYEPPAGDPGIAFPEIDAETIRTRLAEGDGSLATRLPRGWGGGPKGPARIFEEAGLDLVERLASLAARARSPRPHLARRDDSGEAHLFPADPGPIPGWTIVAAESANETANRFYSRFEERESYEQLLGDLRRLLVRRRTRAAKTLRQVEKRLADSDREPEIRRHAELLTAHLAHAKRGMKSIHVPDFDGSAEVEIALDPKLDPKANVDALFRKARRLARGREESETQRAIQESELAEVDRALAELDPPPAPGRLRELAQEIAPSLLGERQRIARRAEPLSEPERRPSLPAGFSPRVYDLPGGWEVWVGRDSKQNDELTHRRASQKDLWFHARGCQGSHVVLRVSSGKGEPPKATILAAASIAAWHSKARKSGLVPVAYTEKRYVRKPRRAPAGTAAMIREKVVMVEPKLPEGSNGS